MAAEQNHNFLKWLHIPVFVEVDRLMKFAGKLAGLKLLENFFPLILFQTIPKLVCQFFFRQKRGFLWSSSFLCEFRSFYRYFIAHIYLISSSLPTSQAIPAFSCDFESVPFFAFVWYGCFFHCYSLNLWLP